MDSKVISLDIETYGAARANHVGKRLPQQTVFHPKKSLYIDGVSKEDLVLTVAITTPEEDPRTSQEPSISKNWNSNLLSGLRPGSTIVLEMWKKMHRECLANWLQYADTIVGMNIQFDILYLRNFDPVFRSLLNFRHTLIDLSVLNYLHSELREERSLKALGPILGAFSYKETLKGSRFSEASGEDLASYNAQDTHNTMLAVSEFAKRISNDFKDTDKASEWCLKFYSRTIWSVIQMSEAGIPMSSLLLESLFNDMEARTDDAAFNAENLNLILQGKGSSLSKDQFVYKVVNHIQNTTNPNILNELEVTEKKKKVSFTKGNRITLLKNLSDTPQSEIFRQSLKFASQHSEAQKLLSSYCYPLLYHRRNKIEDKSSIVIPPNTSPLRDIERSGIPLFEKVEDRIDACNKAKGPIAHKDRFPEDRHPSQGDSFAYPSWYITPSHVKELQGNSGGTIQGRITCKNPSAQTFPPLVKQCIKTRFTEGVILGMDLSQIELRVAALLSGEGSMVRAYSEGLDLHADRARSLWSDYDQLADSQKARRQVGKMMNFADLFLSSANTMYEQVHAQSGGEIDLSIDFFKDVVKSRNRIRPQLTRWQSGLLHEAKTKGSISLPFTGQSRTFIGNLGKSRSEIVNFPIQTTAGNLALCIQQELSDLFRLVWEDSVQKPEIFLQIYDAIYIDCPLINIKVVKELIETSIKRVCSAEGYWGMLEKLTHRTVPLAYDIETLGISE